MLKKAAAYSTLLWVLLNPGLRADEGTNSNGTHIERQVASGTADVLKPTKVHPLVLPEDIAKQIVGPTALFYFSPTCPHCQEVMPSINVLSKDYGLTWLGVASARATRTEVKTFIEEYKPTFEVIQDDLNGSFAYAVAARSTPSLYIVQPSSNPKDDDPPHTVEVTEAYSPFARGMEGLFRMRNRLDQPFHGFTEYQGPRVCGSCHQQEHRSWVITHHASAYSTLYRRERAQDLKCVGCHVTGIDKPGGFIAGDHGSPMRDVTCESCHGPGGPHNPSLDTPVDPKAECIRCHDKDHSIAFSVAKGLPHIDHFAANGLSNDLLKERIRAISSGEAERPLLAFPEGPSVGSKACKSCHKDSHKTWVKSPHAKAMAALKGGEKENPQCVRCHATPHVFGSHQRSSVTDFRIDESVGCESCHGAGQAHAQNPTKDNIVGLGESCPECVIEAVCTRCHTPKWDPQWELKTRLEAVRH